MKKNIISTIMVVISVLFLTQPTNALSREQLKNATYQGIYDEPIQLSEGRYEGKPFVEGGTSRPTVTFIDELIAIGDLNEDRIEDAAVVVVENSGGSGNFRYLAAVVSQNEQPVNQATILLGDRVSIKSVIIKNGQILVEFIEQNQKIQKTYELQGDTLIKKGSENLGALSLNDLEGQTWTLTRLTSGQELMPDTEMTALFADGKISGSSGCNRYSAGVTELDSGKLSIGPAMGTRMACPEPIMQQEDAFLKVLGTVTHFSFSGGKLVLMYDGGGLWFKP